MRQARVPVWCQVGWLGTLKCTFIAVWRKSGSHYTAALPTEARQKDVAKWKGELAQSQPSIFIHYQKSQCRMPRFTVLLQPVPT